MDVQVTLVLPAVLHAQAERLARQLGLTRSALCGEALADFIDMHGLPDEASSGAADAPITLAGVDLVPIATRVWDLWKDAHTPGDGARDHCIRDLAAALRAELLR